MFTSGLISNESFEQVLRSLTQKRAQGTLIIEQPPQRTTLTFSAGRIIDAVMDEAERSTQLRNRLIEAERGDPGEGTLAEVYQRVGETELGAALARVHREQLLDLLVELDLSKPARAQFSQHMTVAFATDAPSLAPAAVLLERQAYQADCARFANLFGSAECIRRSAGESSGEPLAADEQELMSALASGEYSLSELAQKTLFGRVHLQTLLLALHERGLVEIVERSDAATAKTVSEPLSLSAREPAPQPVSQPILGGAESVMRSAGEAQEPHVRSSKPVAAPKSDTRAAAHRSVTGAKVSTDRQSTLSTTIAEIVGPAIVLAGLGLPYFLWRDIFAMFAR